MGSREWDERYAGRGFLWSAGPNRFVAEELAGLPPGAALDPGAGEGRNAVWLAGRGWTVTAVDFSAAGLAKARQLAGARGVTADWVQAGLLGYQPPPGSLGLVLVAYLHLVPARRAIVLRRAAAALAPGGTALVVGHDLASLTGGTGGPQDPALLYTPEAITAGLAGLVIQRAGRVRRSVKHDGDTREATDTLVRAVRPPTASAWSCLACLT